MRARASRTPLAPLAGVGRNGYFSLASCARTSRTHARFSAALSLTRLYQWCLSFSFSLFLLLAQLLRTLSRTCSTRCTVMLIMPSGVSYALYRTSSHIAQHTHAYTQEKKTLIWRINQSQQFAGAPNLGLRYKVAQVAVSELKMPRFPIASPTALLAQKSSFAYRRTCRSRHRCCRVEAHWWSGNLC